MKQIGLTFLLIAAWMTACAAPTPDPQAQIRVAVAATLQAMPTTTPMPLPTPYPTYTPLSLANLFCSYRFCIGHPSDVYLIDQGARRNPPLPSTYDYGVLFSYSTSLFLQMAWTLSGPSFDPQGVMRLIMDPAEQFQGQMETLLTPTLNIFYQPITVSSQSVLPFGGLAAWQCGGRDFVWKVYTPQDGMALGLLKEAVARFRCE
ncbi:MAG: hypothetical protein DDG60_06735 [Anaerolineae bacterium]|nr:MAG: hypothetical protein DDG60_06735 [Anaerolineae bacterium]